MMKMLSAAALALLIAVPAALAQGAEPNAAPIPKDGKLVASPAGTPIEAGMATGTPGVGLDTNAETETGGTGGAGGLANGVGASGTLAPSTSGSGERTVAPTNEGEGIPLGAPATAD